MSALAYGVVAWLFVIGLYGIVTSRNLIHLVACLTVSQSATYVLLLAVGYRRSAAAPVLLDRAADAPVVDPAVQAMVLTDIVVGATVTALLLALVIQVHKRRRSLDPRDLRPLHR
jgi:multicomponent Na+:H+ antiporter subunit C